MNQEARSQAPLSREPTPRKKSFCNTKVIQLISEGHLCQTQATVPTILLARLQKPGCMAVSAWTKLLQISFALLKPHLPSPPPKGTAPKPQRVALGHARLIPEAVGQWGQPLSSWDALGHPTWVLLSPTVGKAWHSSGSPLVGLVQKSN